MRPSLLFEAFFLRKDVLPVAIAETKGGSQHFDVTGAQRPCIRLCERFGTYGLSYSVKMVLSGFAAAGFERNA